VRRMPDVNAIDDFASLLQGMKERTGRSYAALARRAGVSSSALHRYCCGKTVPTEFEAVERLGRAAGATQEELLELHRRWAVAVAAREGNSGPVAAAVPASADVPSPGPAPGHHVPLRRRRPVPALLVLAVLAAVGLVATQWLDRAPTTSREAAAAGWRPLFSPTCSPVVTMGQHDECVREVQTLLRKAGTTLAVDGDFGPETLRRVTAFQVLAGLGPNGVVNDATKRALYDGMVDMRTWEPRQVERRIRQVFPEEPSRAVRIGRCQSFLDPLYVLPNTNGSRNWGVFQLNDSLVRRYGGTPRRAYDPEWNIQTARRAWAEHRDFRDWPYCDPGGAPPRAALRQTQQSPRRA
jgi:hypothetical protein